MASSLVGRKLGKYLITDLLGQGGMATVYKGYQEEIDRYVAVKVLPPHPGLDQQFIERFRLEARTIARLQHPHILPLYDYGVEDDILYLVIAYVEGGSLADRIERGRLGLREIDRLLRQIASALDYAHRQGIIHRDIKPDNILLDREGNPLLADFGIAKLVEGDTRLTATGGIVGTPAYIAPEQGSGSGVSASSDIYSLGVVVYEMITGRQPYAADTPMQVVLKHMTEPVPSVSAVIEGLPSSIEVIMQRVLAKNPQNRYQTAGEFAEDFSQAIRAGANTPLEIRPAPDPTSINQAPVVDTLPPTATSTQPQTTIIQQAGPNPLLLLGGFAIIALLVVGVVALLINSQRPQPVASDSTNAPTTAATTAPTVEVAAAPTSTAVPTFGRLSFSTTKALGDTMTLQVQNLKPPNPGQVYVAWLKNTRDGSALAIGQLTLDALGSGVLPPYTDRDERTLPAFYNAVAVTLEQSMGDQPGGEVVYSAQLPAELTTAQGEIFLNSDGGVPFSALNSTDYSAAQLAGGEKAGLLDSAIAEARRAAQHAGLAQRAGTVGGMRTHAEHTINILSGAQEDYNGDGRGENPGFGIGLTRLVDLIDQQLQAVAGAPDSSVRLQADLELIRVCLDNTRQRTDAVIDLEQQLLAASDVESVAQQATDSTRISAQIVSGEDLNGNGQVDPFEGECGLEQIKTYGMLVSAMNLVEGPLK